MNDNVTKRMFLTSRLHEVQDDLFACLNMALALRHECAEEVRDAADCVGAALVWLKSESHKLTGDNQ